MRIAILGATNIKHMSLLSHYLNHIDLYINEVDIIYTDKYYIEELIPRINNYLKYRVYTKVDWSLINTAIAYHRFRPYAKQILEAHHSDFVIA
ncbi:hypothetical protein [Staphylococcus aureus]|uniref:hypothetical protein n=1 Tax=Staphylococcus aureus TaxID=1280 RepID=UPI00272EFC27|nr:hypothetical protein [Staphylococcus aureus]